MRKTKIVCTIGPATRSEDMLTKLINTGMNVARLNFSHGNHQEKEEVISRIKKLGKKLNKPIGIMVDLKGPEIRIGKFTEGEILLENGQHFILTTEKVMGDNEKVSVSYENLPDEVEAGTVVLIDDGLIELKVEKINKTEIYCKVINGGILSNNKGVNLPGLTLNLPTLTDNDIEDIKFGLKQGAHFIAASFVRTAEDVKEIKNVLKQENNNKVKIIAKIENQAGVNNVDDILEIADGIMVARGDLGIEVPLEKVPIIQKMIITRCNSKAKPVIIATQMLDSMIRNPMPTRAEASDVTNAIFDGADATMLSGESAVGKYPIESVQRMAKIIEEAEMSSSYHSTLRTKVRPDPDTITEAISFATCETARDIEAEAIISSTRSGLTARMVSSYRPLTPIIAVTPDNFVLHTLTLIWGVNPFLVDSSKSTDEMIRKSINVTKENNLIKNEDVVVLTAGVPVEKKGTTNLIQVEVVE